jgi:hypothetical protein
MVHEGARQHRLTEPHVSLIPLAFSSDLSHARHTGALDNHKVCQS